MKILVVCAGLCSWKDMNESHVIEITVLRMVVEARLDCIFV